MLFKRLSLVAFLCLSSFASAWDGRGHEQIADIAWVKLTHDAKVEVAKILASGDTVTGRSRTSSYTVTPPSSGYTDEYLETVVRPVFDRAATWCDEIKGGDSAKYDARIDADNAASPGVHPPTDGSRRGEDNRCKTWHYYDDPINAPGDSTPHPARASNAVRALTLIRAEFESQEHGPMPDRAAELYDLFWIEHVFGDLTQPLHCSESYVYNPKGDAGGNTFMTAAPNSFSPGRPMNLHSYWDSGIDHAIAADPTLGANADVEKVTAAWLADASAQPADADATDLDPTSWVVEGHDRAVSFVYAGIKPMGALDDAYKKMQVELCKKLAVVGGLRLANYLNAVLTAHP